MGVLNVFAAMNHWGGYKMQINKPGRYVISAEDYHTDNVCVQPCLSRSVIKDLLFQSPAKAAWNHPKLNPSFKPDKGGGKFDIGLACHALLLEGIDNIIVVDADDWRTKAAKEARERAWGEGKSPLLREQYEQAKLMVEVAEQQIVACEGLGIKNLRADGDAELTYVWEENGVWLKVRPDWISKDRTIILDFKTTGQSANPSDVGKTIINMGYDIQNVLYQRGVRAVEGISPRFIFLVQEVEEPYFCSFVELPGMADIMGEQKIENGIFLWRECMATGNWFAYPNRVVKVDIPRWAITDWEQRSGKIGVDIE